MINSKEIEKKEINGDLKKQKGKKASLTIEDYYIFIAALRMKKKMGNLTNTHLIKEKKKELARLLTDKNNK